MPMTLEQFIAAVESSGLFSADDMRSFHASLPPERMTDDPQKLARELVDAGKLTRYQAAAVYQGKAKGLSSIRPAIPSRRHTFWLPRV